MTSFRVAAAAIAALSFTTFTTLAHAQGYTPPDTDLQKEKMQAFAMIEGEWRGEAWMIGPDRQKSTFIQTESVAYALDSLIMRVHGKGVSKDDPSKTVFEAIATISYDEKQQEYRIRSYSGGHYGDYKITPTETGFEWAIPFTSYVATIDGDNWIEKGVRQLPDGKEFQFIELNVTRQE